MAENTFKSPGFFEQEIELTAEKQQPTGVPAGIIGASQMGPAFVPLTLGTFKDFENRFGTLTPEKFAPYAVREWLKNRQSVTFCRVLGAGANSTSADFTNTRAHGFVKNAGFKALPLVAGEVMGATQFLTATHTISAKADVGFPVFTDNDTWALNSAGNQTPGTKESTFAENYKVSSPASPDDVLIVRAMILNTSGSFFTLDEASVANSAFSGGTSADIELVNGSDMFKMKLTLDGYSNASDIDLTWGNDQTGTKAAYSRNTALDGSEDVPNKIYEVSLDPDNTKYSGKVLNTDPKKFQDEGHLLWLDFALERELAPVKNGSSTVHISDGANSAQGDYGTAQGNNTFQKAFGLFNARYQAPKTTSFISQPFGAVEYDLFHFECLSDGHVANNEFKISISNIRKSADPNYEYGTFDVSVRKYGDNDFQPQVLERFVGCSLDPDSENFVARKIGDKKVVFDFDADLAEERRLVISGRYPNKSLNIRIVMNESIYKYQVPKAAVPFGFRGIPVLNTYGNLSVAAAGNAQFPPLPFTFKATKGEIKTRSLVLLGDAGDNERVDARVHFGVKTTRIEDAAINENAIFQSNLSSQPSRIVKAYTKFMGIKGGTSASGMFQSDHDAYNNNKFTLARVALGKEVNSSPSATYHVESLDKLSGASSEMKSACYIRNGVPNASTYYIEDPYHASNVQRITLASLIHDDTANNFNKFSSFAKFTNVFHGGWDGLNFLDEDIEDLNDKASSSEGSGAPAVTGKAASTITGGLGLLGTDDGTMMGTGKDNNVIASYRQAIDMMTDPMTVRHNLLVIPSIRDPYVADHAANKVREYSMAMYIMDIPNQDKDQNRIFDTGSRPDVEYTSNALEGRAIDNNFAASYFPDVFITDPVNNRRVLVPASIAALGALSYSDNVSYPWFAPAGFNRGALDFVENVRTRLSVSDRDDLYERRINPIANFPNGGFVIFGQKTMQMTKSALDRVNVRRLLLEVKRQVVEVANVVLFEQNTPQTRARFVNLVQPRLALIQAQAGIEKFRVICDDTNNTPADAEENRLNGKIVLIPTRTIEFIAIDFIITNAGVSFE